jgi:tetratricopeptide (TPR) repeat protein
MKPVHTLRRLAGATSCAVILAACNTVPQVPEIPKSTVGALMEKASQAAASGQKEQAVTLWKQAAAAFPAEKAPWVSIAQTRYDAGQYGEAIVSAQEILVRDPNDQLANSIIAISGLRLSTRALADLSRQNNLSGPLRTESQDLAKLLRESLGETVLVPPQPAQASAAKAASNTARGGTPAKKGAAKARQESSADPFSGLK